MSDIKNELQQKFSNLKEKFSTAYTRSQIDTILGELGTLQLEAASYGLNFDISALQQLAETKAKKFEVEQNIEKFQAREEEFLKAQRMQILADEEKEIAQRMAMLNHSYNEFIKNITKDTKRVEESNKRLDKTINKLETEGVVDHEELNREILTHEEIEELNKGHKKLYENHRKLTEEHKKIHAEVNELNTTIENLKQTLQKKNLTREKINELEQELKFNQEMLKIYKPCLEQAESNKRIADQEIIKREKERKKNKNKIEKLGSKIEECYKQEPEKHQESYGKYIALKNQYEAIETNGIVKNVSHHNKVLSNIKTDKVKKQATVKDSIGNLCPSYTPNVNSINSKTRGI
ncbi:MAG: hypothetical protein ACIPMY_07000 [Rickettsia endosymbiont of Pentastiridius leporinus]